MNISGGIKDVQYFLSPLFTLFTLLIITPSGGCSPASKKPVPSWIHHIPGDGEYVYSVGWCGKTVFKRDAEECAVRRAIKEMALSLSAAVVGAEKMVSLRSRTSINIWSDVFIFEDLLKSLAEHMEVVDIWRDIEGRAGSKEYTYALVRVPKSQIDITEVFNTAVLKSSGGEVKVSCAGSKIPFAPEDLIQAEGICGKNPFRYSAYMCARKRALAELAKTVALKIQGRFFEMQKGSYHTSASDMLVVVGAVLTGARVKKAYQDSLGNTHVILTVTGKDIIRSMKITGRFLLSLETSPYQEIGKCLILLSSEE